MRNRQSFARPPASSERGCIFISLAMVALLIVIACITTGVLVNDWLDNLGGDDETDEIETVSSPVFGARDLRVAYSPEKGALFRSLIDAFNAQGLAAPDGARLRVEGVEMEPSAMIDATLNGEIDAMSPDSSLWLSQLDRAWADHVGDSGALVVGYGVRYAVSPVVIITWRDVAQEMGWPAESTGWRDLMNRAQFDPDFAWSHASTTTTSGLLATLAEFYAGAGKTRDLTIDDVQAQSTLDYVAAIERTVSIYGQGEWDVAQQIDVQMRQNGTRSLDAFIGQEQLVLYLNQLGYDMVAIYPAEGAMWADHPLVLLETGRLSDTQRLAFQHFSGYVTGPEAQRAVLEAGYRPADLTIDLAGPGSPFAASDAVDASQPRASLQIPGARVIDVVKDVWYYTKRPTDVYLVVDTSGSMDGEKLDRVKEALYTFLEGVRSERDRVGLIEFYDTPHPLTGLENLTPDYRDALLRGFSSLRAGGETALLDGVKEAYDRLQTEGNREHINAIVVMTDGVENASRISLSSLTATLRQESGVPVVVFAVAYGTDADYRTLESIVEATDGRVWEGTLENIRNIYQVISTYF